jgi:type IV pilus assembly protein PilB
MAEESLHEGRIGELLVEHGFITQGQLERALEAQKGCVPYKPLGEVCKDLGLISRTSLRDFLNEQHKHVLLGDLLLRMGVISEDNLIGVLATQQETKEKLGEILVRKSFISQEGLTKALGIQLTIPTIDPESKCVDVDLVHEVSSKFLYNKKVIPICRKQVEGVITVAMDDPLDHETILDLEKIFNARIEPAMLTHGEISSLLDAVFDSWSVRMHTAGGDSEPSPESQPKKSSLNFR